MWVLSMKHLTVILAFLVMLSAPVAAQDFQKGFAAAQAGDFATALQEWTPLAEAGYDVAQYNLGLVYEYGSGIVRFPQPFPRTSSLLRGLRTSL